jgi:hypothetical protein
MLILSSTYVKQSNNFLLNMTPVGSSAKHHLVVSILFLLVVDATAWVFSSSSRVMSQTSTACAVTNWIRKDYILSRKRKSELFESPQKTNDSVPENMDDNVPMPISNNYKEADSTSRRSFFSSTVPFCCAASTLCGIVSALEEGEQDAVAWATPTLSNTSGDDQLRNQDPQLQAAFQDIQEELNGEVFIELGKGGGVLFLKQLIVEERYDTIKEFTKFYDAEFRKVKLGKVRKLLTDKKLKEEALQLSNAITFDLIGINKASRVKDGNEAIRYWTELEEDIIKFLQLQKQAV